MVVCEGEKSADAAAALFPKSVCMTSPGGSGAARNADWSPLSGRTVLIWPDADAPGLKYAADVGANLSGHGCSVSVIDAMALAALSPDGGERAPQQGWDAADAIEDWRDDLAALRSAADGLARAHDPGPAYLSFGPYEMTDNGLRSPLKKGERRQNL